MIYEICIVTNQEVDEAKVPSLTKIVHDVVKEGKGEVLIEDDWGVLSFAQMSSDKSAKGRFLYFIFKTSNEDNNKELLRRLKINENVHKYMIVKLGKDVEQEKIVKNLKMPYSKKYPGSVTDVDDASVDVAKDRRRFVRKKTCWFTAKNLKADWKDPATFAWLINEFGKIAPARISGISYKHQRFATQAIKRARQMGISSHLSNRFAR